MKILLSLAAVGAMTMSAAPATAQHQDNQGNWNNNGQSRNGDRWNNHDRERQSRRSHHARWSTGYRFGPRYSYTAYNALPQQYVTQYHLSRRNRYVYTDGYVYQVDPATYAITRVLSGVGGY